MAALTSCMWMKRLTWLCESTLAQAARSSCNVSGPRVVKRKHAQRLKHKMRQESALAALANLSPTSHGFKAIRERVVYTASAVLDLESGSLNDVNHVPWQPAIIGGVA